MKSTIYRTFIAAIVTFFISLNAWAQYFPTPEYPLEIQQQFAAEVEQKYGFVDIEVLSSMLADWGLSQPLPGSDAEQTEEGTCTGTGGICVLPTDNQDTQFPPVRNLRVVTRANGRARPGFKVRWNKPRRLPRRLRNDYELDHYQVHLEHVDTMSYEIFEVHDRENRAGRVRLPRRIRFRNKAPGDYIISVRPIYTEAAQDAQGVTLRTTSENDDAQPVKVTVNSEGDDDKAASWEIKPTPVEYPPSIRDLLESANPPLYECVVLHAGYDPDSSPVDVINFSCRNDNDYQYQTITDITELIEFTSLRQINLNNHDISNISPLVDLHDLHLVDLGFNTQLSQNNVLDVLIDQASLQFLFLEDIGLTNIPAWHHDGGSDQISLFTLKLDSNPLGNPLSYSCLQESDNKIWVNLLMARGVPDGTQAMMQDSDLGFFTNFNYNYIYAGNHNFDTLIATGPGCTADNNNVFTGRRQVTIMNNDFSDPVSPPELEGMVNAIFNMRETNLVFLNSSLPIGCEINLGGDNISTLNNGILTLPVSRNLSISSDVFSCSGMDALESWHGDNFDAEVLDDFLQTNYPNVFAHCALLSQTPVFGRPQICSPDAPQGLSVELLNRGVENRYRVEWDPVPQHWGITHYRINYTQSSGQIGGGQTGIEIIDATADTQHVFNAPALGSGKFYDFTIQSCTSEEADDCSIPSQAVEAEYPLLKPENLEFDTQIGTVLSWEYPLIPSGSEPGYFELSPLFPVDGITAFQVVYQANTKSYSSFINNIQSYPGEVILIKACIDQGDTVACGPTAELSNALPPAVDTTIAPPINVQLTVEDGPNNSFLMSWNEDTSVDYYRVAYITGGNSIAPVIVEENSLDISRYVSFDNDAIKLQVQSCIRDRDNGDRCSSAIYTNTVSIDEQPNLGAVSGLCWVEANTFDNFHLRWKHNVIDIPQQFIGVTINNSTSTPPGPDTIEINNVSYSYPRFASNTWYWESNSLKAHATSFGSVTYTVHAEINGTAGFSQSITPVTWNGTGAVLDTSKECTGALALDNTSDPAQSPDTDGGPGDLNPGHWGDTPDYRGTGWRFYWASDLRYDGLNASYGITYDLIGIWYSYAMINGEWSPVWYYSRLKLTDPNESSSRFYEGDLIYPQKGLSPDQHVGSVRIYFDNTNIRPVPLPGYQESDCFPNFDPQKCSEPNQNVWINIEVDHALLSGSLNHQLNDISLVSSLIFNEQHSKDEHYSGLWLENGTLFEGGEALEDSDFIFVEWIEKAIHSMGLNFFDQNGNPVWLVSQVCSTPNPTCRAAADSNGAWRLHDNSGAGNWHVMYPGVNPLGIVPESWGPTSDHHAALGTSAKAGRVLFDTNNDERLDYITGKLCAHISTFNLGTRSVSLNVGEIDCANQSHATSDINKVASLHSIKYRLDNDDDETTCELSDTNPTCNILLTWFTDDYFPTIEPFYLEGGSGSLIHLAELCTGDASANVFGGDPDFVVADLPCEINQPGVYTFYLYSRTSDVGGGITPDSGDDKGDIVAMTRTLHVTGECQTGCGTVEDVPDEARDNSTMHTFALAATTHDASVGAVAGEAGVSGGSASYSVPINIPPGRAGMQPTVSLNYNSRGGNGSLGMGWSLSTGSSISRCPSTVAQDGFSKGVTFDDSDRLCLDGQRLMVVEGQYWASGSLYRTEIDSFSRIQLNGASAAVSGCNSTFTVKSKDNITRHYGGGAATVSPDDVNGATTCAVASSWLLTSENDPVGNDIQYVYTDFGAGEHLLDQIMYTGMNGSAGNRSVRLTYDDRDNSGQDDVSVSFLNGYVSRQTKRLDRIDTYVGSEHVRRYGLAYSNSQATSRLLLNSIQECAYTVAVETCLPPTILDWGDERPQFTWEPVMTDRNGDGSTQLLVDDPLGIGADDQPNPGRLISLPDLDGDGSREWEFSDQDNTYIASIDAEGIERWRVTKDLTLPAQGSGGSGPVSQTQFRIRLNDDPTLQQQEALQIATDYIASLSDDEIIATMALEEMAPEPDAQDILDQRVLLGEQTLGEIEAFQLSAVQSRDQYVDINSDGIVDLYGYVNNNDVDTFTFAVINDDPGASGVDLEAAFDLITTNITQFGRPVVGDVDGDGDYDVLLRVPVTVTNAAGQAVATDALQLWLNNGDDPSDGLMTFTLTSGAQTQIIDNIGGIIYTWPVNVPIESDGSIVYRPEISAAPSMADYNGDGVVDIVISSRMLDIFYTGEVADITFTVVQPLGYQQAPVRVLLNKGPQDNNIDFILAELSDETVADSDSLDVPFSRSVYHLGLAFDPRRSYQLPMDINGDGLNDILLMPPFEFDANGNPQRPLCQNLSVPTSCWYAQINLGGVIQNTNPVLGPIPSGLYSDPIHIPPPSNIEDSLTESSQSLPLASESQRLVSPRYAALIRPFDWDNDGITELMVPRSIDAGICLEMFHRDGTGSPEPDLIGLYCPTNMAGDFRSWPEGLIDEDTTSVEFISGSIHKVGFGHRDKSTYNMGIIEFSMSNQNGVTSIQSNLIEADETGLIGSARTRVDDFYGDGINDLVTIYGCIDNNIGPPTGVGFRQSNCTPALLSPYTEAVGYDQLIHSHAITTYGSDGCDLLPCSQVPGEFRGYYISRPTNNRTEDGRQGLILDMMTGVTDGFGNRYNWDYAPLSSRTPERSFETGLPLYSIPSRDIDQDYLSVYGNDEYFYFTSSMYVVSAFHASNGIFSSEPLQNTTYYGYEEAVYNNQGRGFQGFRKIVSEQLTTDPISDDAQNNLRSVSVFHQLFPLAGRLEATYTQLAVDEYIPEQDRDLNTGRFVFPNELLNSTENRWSCRSASAAYKTLCNIESGTLASAQAEIIGSSNHGIYHPVLAGDPNTINSPSSAATISIQRGLESIAFTETYAAQQYDAFGNITLRASRLINRIDSTGINDVTITNKTNNNFINDAGDNWWLGRLTSSINQDLINYPFADGRPSPQEYINVTQLFDYHVDSRKPECQVRVEGNQSASTCNTVFPDAWVWQRTSTLYDTYGNPSIITVDASNLPATRSTNTDFSASNGYFPDSVTNAVGHPVQTTFDAREGSPVQVSDANGLLTRMAYDSFGRELQTWFPNDESVSWDDYGQHYAPRSRVAYLTLPNCPAAPVSAVYCTISIADGKPVTRQYFDRLNRILTLRTSGFNGDVVAATTYNARGQVVAETVPAYGAVGSAGQTTFQYDPLGRTTQKSRPASSSPSATMYTHYEHFGLKTRIRVGSSQSPPTGVCATSASDIMGLSDNLCVERTYLANDWLHRTVDAHGKQTRFWYDGQGNPRWIKDSQNNLTKAQYNPFGHRTLLEDPDMGIWSYTYNGLGELQSQIDANGQQTVYSYDDLGRQTLRVVSNPSDPELGSIADTWEYDEPNGGQTRNGQLTSEQRTQGMLQFNGDDPVPFAADTWQKFYAYDAALRPTGYSTTLHPHSYGNQGNAPIINASTYTVSMAYDSYFGRIKSVTYPQSGVGEYTRYNINGFVIEQGHSNDYADPGKFWHQVLEMTASGQISKERYGNGVEQVYNHDPRTQQMTATAIIATDANLDQTHSYSHDLFGNLIQQIRTASIGTSTEDFEYDHQHRLRNSTRTGIGGFHSISYSYDELGNLTSKSDYGNSYSYGAISPPENCHVTPNANPGPHAVTTVSPAGGGLAYRYGYDANGNLICSTSSHNGPMQIHYDPTNKPFRVQRGSNQTEFWYGSDDQRYFQRDNNAGDTIYIGKLFEQKSNGQKKYYLGNYAVLTADLSSGDSISYLHTDRLGSIIAISDEDGDNVQGSGRGFDPFGKPREADWDNSNGQDNAPPLADGDLNGYDTTTRGFTGHEHLNGTDLIHMNGRAYDYNLGRFLSVDPVIQFPVNSQSLNPYSYIMNNPMAGTDPTGYTGGCPESDPECNSRKNEDEDDAKPGTTTDKCGRGASCKVTHFNSGKGNGQTNNKGDDRADLGSRKQIADDQTGELQNDGFTNLVFKNEDGNKVGLDALGLNEEEIQILRELDRAISDVRTRLDLRITETNDPELKRYIMELRKFYDTIDFTFQNIRAPAGSSGRSGGAARGGLSLAFRREEDGNINVRLDQSNRFVEFYKGLFSEYRRGFTPTSRGNYRATTRPGYDSLLYIVAHESAHTVSNVQNIIGARRIRPNPIMENDADTFAVDLLEIQK